MVHTGMTETLRWGGLAFAAVLSLSSATVTVEAQHRQPIDKGADAILEKLQKMPRVGYIRDVNRGTLGWDLHFARERKLEDGGRQIVLATDRPISAWEAFNRPRSADYDFTLADIRFDGDGKGVGKLAVAAKISTDDKTGRIEIENFSSEPVRLTEVTSSRKPSS